jgi:hypothetical protein
MAVASIRSLRNGLSPVTGLSRDDLVVGDVVTVESATLGFTAYQWELLFVPGGSSAALSPSGGVTGPGPLTFTVDEEGPYLVKLTATDGTGTTVNYVRLRALTAYGSLALVAAGEKFGAVPVPSDASPVGWANDQNGNLLKLLGLVQSVVGVSQKAGENFSQGDALSLYWDTPNSELRVRRAKSDNPTLEYRAVYGIAGAAGVTGNLVPVSLSLGTLVEANFDTVLSSADFGKIVFLSTSSGLCTVTPPTSPGQDVFRLGLLSALNGALGVFAFQPQFVARFP